MKSKLSRKYQSLAENIILIDGFSGSGKSLVGPLFGYLKKGEFWQVNTLFDRLAILHYCEKISNQSVRALAKIGADEIIYNLFIGRNVNFRGTDQSSPILYGLKKKYFNRLKSKDKNFAANKIKKIKPILPIVLHYIFGYSDILLKVFDEKLKLYIVTLRSPLYLINKWHKEKWVQRIGKENRDYILCIKYKNLDIPWYCKDYKKSYLSANNYEKCILTVYELYKRIFTMYKKSNQNLKKKILLIFFEDFIKNPNLYINYICKNIKTIPNKNINYYLKKVSLPRNGINEFDLKKYKLNNFDKKISKKYKNKLKELNDLYVNFYNEHKLSNKNYDS